MTGATTTARRSGTFGVRLVTAVRAALSSLGIRSRTPRPVRRVLVAHYLLLGDTVLLAPLLKVLALRYPDAERVVLARPAVAPLFDGRPYGATVLPFDRRDGGSRRRIVDSGPYDLAIVPDDNRYAWLARAAGARRVVAFADDRPRWKNWMVDDAVAYPLRPGAWADFVAQDLGAASIPPSGYAVGQWPAPRHAPFELPADPYVVLHVGASTPLKQWPPERWRAVADGLGAAGLTVVWSGGAGERDALANVGPRAHEIDLVGRLDLPQLWHLLARARLLVCPDTGVAHLARLVGVPTVALFGPASHVVHGPGAFWRDAPFRVVTVEHFPCRDQRTLYRRDVAWVRRCGRRYDPNALPAGKGDPAACGRALCMEAIETAAVVDAMRDVVRTAGR